MKCAKCGQRFSWKMLLVFIPFAAQLFPNSYDELPCTESLAAWMGRW